MQITITVNLEFYASENSNLKKETDNQMELPFFTKYRGRPKVNWLDLKHVLEEENETKLRVSNLKFVCEKLKICLRTAYRIWKEMKQHLN